MARFAQKEEERRVLEAARRVCCTFPVGEIQLAEEPDLRIEAGTELLAVEVTELLRSGYRFRPAQDERFHHEVLRLAERMFYETPNAEPVCVGVSFLDEIRCELENLDGWNRLADKKTGRDAVQQGPWGPHAKQHVGVPCDLGCDWSMRRQAHLHPPEGCRIGLRSARIRRPTPARSPKESTRGVISECPAS